MKKCLLSLLIGVLITGSLMAQPGRPHDLLDSFNLAHLISWEQRQRGVRAKQSVMEGHPDSLILFVKKYDPILKSMRGQTVYALSPSLLVCRDKLEYQTSVSEALSGYDQLMIELSRVNIQLDSFLHYLPSVWYVSLAGPRFVHDTTGLSQYRGNGKLKWNIIEPSVITKRIKSLSLSYSGTRGFKLRHTDFPGVVILGISDSYMKPKKVTIFPREIYRMENLKAIVFYHIFSLKQLRKLPRKNKLEMIRITLQEDVVDDLPASIRCSKMLQVFSIEVPHVTESLVKTLNGLGKGVKVMLAVGELRKGDHKLLDRITSVHGLRVYKYDEACLEEADVLLEKFARYRVLFWGSPVGMDDYLEVKDFLNGEALDAHKKLDNLSLNILQELRPGWFD